MRVKKSPLFLLQCVIWCI